MTTMITPNYNSYNRYGQYKQSKPAFTANPARTAEEVLTSATNKSSKFFKPLEDAYNTMTDIIADKFTSRLVNWKPLNYLADKFKDGTALVYRLTPANYHRYCYVADGRIKSHKRINGVLHCVRPVATSTLPVFVQNSREYQVIETEKFGTVVQMEIGALMVGKISNHRKYIDNSMVWTGDEKGYFEFGGSTIVVLLQKDAVEFSDEIKNKIAKKEEFPIKISNIIGK